MELLEDRATPAGLVAAFAFDEGTGSTVNDSSGNLNTGTIANATWSTTGRFGNALSFNGTNAMVSVNDSASLDLTTAMTLEAWVRPSSVDYWKTVILKESAGDLAYSLFAGTPESHPAAYFDPTGGAGIAAVNGVGALQLDAWSHLAMTYDGATMRLYVNGNLNSSQAATGGITTSSDPLRIGGNTLYGEFFSGLIDEVRIYDRALDISEIQTDMDTPVGNPPADSEPPTVSLLMPGEGAELSHVAILSATATDNLGISDVEFFVDGTRVGADNVAPYVFTWDTTAATNGPHVVTAVARDGSGNETTSDPVNITTLNPAFANELVVPDISDATTMAFLPDGRMLVGELTNKVLLVQAGAHRPDSQPLLNLDYTYQFGEQGLMDIAVDPDFSQNGYFYVYYTKGFAGAQNHNRLSRFTLNGNAVVPGSETVLWQDDAVANHEHHGGAIAFGTDGKIYFTTGDEFVPSMVQQLNNYWGKVLRINPDGSIPLDNPFYDGAGPNKDEIWAYGFRNPYRMSIDPVTGRVFIGDVGGNDASTAIEELDLGVPGANYGWPLEEGVGGVPGTTPPIYSYPHNGRDAAITAGFVYRGSQFPSEYYGSFFFGDYAQNTISRLTFDAQGDVAEVVDFWPADGSLDQLLPGDVVKMVEGPDGLLYYVDIGFDGAYNPNVAAIRRIRYVNGNLPPVVVASGDPTAGQPSLTVDFSSVGSFDPEGTELAYDWDFGDGSTSTDANPTHVYTTAGPYVATLTVSDGVNYTLSDNIEITVGTPPVPTILGPADGTFFQAGDVIAFSGSATDLEDGVLPASAFTWEIRFHHEGHIHPAGVLYDTQSGQLAIPTTGHDFQGNTNYELVLTVTDSSGLSATTSVTLLPDKVDLSFDSLPSGLTVEIDGISRQTPFVLDDLIGFQHTITAPHQASGGDAYIFLGWSDGGAQSHDIVVPSSNQSYVATFDVQPITLPGDYNSDEVVDAADYLVWRRQLGNAVVLPNDTTPGSVTAADFDVWTANFGATAAGQGQQSAVSASTISSPSTSTAAVESDEIDPVVIIPLPEDSTATSIEAASKPTPTAGIVTEVAVPHRRQRRPARSYRTRDLALSQSTKDSLLLTSLRKSEEGVHRGPIARAAKVDVNGESHLVDDFAFLKALDNIFAELGQARESRLGAR